MSSVPMSTAVDRRRRLRAVAAAALAASVTGAARGAYTYTNVDAAAASAAGVATYSSRAFSINSSAEVQGYYQTTNATSSRVYFTLPAGQTTATKYPTGLTSPASGSSGGSALGQTLNDGGTYLATSTAATPNPGGSVNPVTSTFTPFPVPTTYAGTFTYTASNGATYTQTQSASQFVPIAIGNSGSAVGNVVYAATGGPASVTSVAHGAVYNSVTQTSTDIGGNPAGITYNAPFSTTSAAVKNAVATSSLVGTSSNGRVLVGSQGNAAASFSGSPTDAIYGAQAANGTYAFSDLATLVGTIVPTGDTYVSSTGTAVSQNGQYVVGSYTASDGTTTFTRSFEVINDSTAIDLGALPGNNFRNVLDAVSVNDSGDVVGYGYLGSTTIHAFLYSGGTLSDLNGLAPTPANGGTYVAAYGIDDAGDITGYSVVPAANGSTTSTAGTTAFLLTTAVPEPGSASLAVAGGAMLLGGRRRQQAGAGGRSRRAR